MLFPPTAVQRRCLFAQICQAHLNMKKWEYGESEKWGEVDCMHFSMSVNDSIMLLPHLVSQYRALTKMDQSKLSESVWMT